MKTIKLRIIIFVIAITYNLLLGLYLKDFLVLSQTLTAFYLLSVLPTFFLLIEARSRAMRATVYIVLVLDIVMNAIYYICCRRLLAVMTMVFLVVELMYFITFANQPRKDSLMTKIPILVITSLILVTMIFTYIFVCKPEAPYLSNGGATLWDTQTEELADEICAGCDTDAEKVQAIYQWIIQNFEYDYDYQAFIQYFDVRQTLHTHKGVCYDFSNLFAALCRSQNIPCYVVDGTPYDNSTESHTWNRVFYNNSWWDVDVTNDISASKGNGNIYGFHKLENSRSSDAEYIITSTQTALNIRERIKGCNKFILLATNGAIESKWCNWELGYGDAHKFKKNIALFQMKPQNTSDGAYKGSEYMSIYPYITYFDGSEKYTNGKPIDRGYYVRREEPDGNYITPLSDWFNQR